MEQLFVNISSNSGRLLLSLSWQATILIAIIWASFFFFKNARKEYQYYLWLAVIIRLCLPFNYSTPIGAADKALAFTEREAQSISMNIIENVPPLNNVPRSIFTEDIKGLFTTGNIFTVWLVIMIILISIIIVSLLYINSKLKKCPVILRNDLTDFLNKKLIELGIKKHVGIYYQNLDFIEGPMVIGIFKPKIFLPAFIVDEWPLEKIEPILLHELIHIKHNDIAINTVQITVQAFFFFHPFVWFVNRRINELREELCDDRAIYFLDNNRKHYLEQVVEVIDGIRMKPKILWSSLSFSEKRCSLLRRVARIADDNYRGYRSLRNADKVSIVAVSLFSFLLASNGAENGMMKNQAIAATTSPTISLSFKTTPRYLDVIIIKDGTYLVDGNTFNKKTNRENPPGKKKNISRNQFVPVYLSQNILRRS